MSEQIQARDIYYKDGSVRKQIVKDGKWIDLYAQENAVAIIDWDVRNIKFIEERFWMPYEQAKAKYGGMPNFPHLTHNSHD